MTRVLGWQSGVLDSVPGVATDFLWDPGQLTESVLGYPCFAEGEVTWLAAHTVVMITLIRTSQLGHPMISEYWKRSRGQAPKL